MFKLAASLVLLAQAAHAGEVYYTVTTPVAPLPHDFTALLPQFDPSIGALDYVTFSANVYVQGTVGAENVESDPTACHLFYPTATMEARLQGGGSFYGEFGDYWITTPCLGTYDGTTDFAGTSGVTEFFGPFFGSGNGINYLQPSQVLDNCSGMENVTAMASAQPALFNNGQGCTPPCNSDSTHWATVTSDISGYVRFTVWYHYNDYPQTFCRPSSYYGVVCPCSNDGTNACANSVNPAGATLQPGGASSISADTFTLYAWGMPTGTSVLFFQGSTSRFAGTSFGDGLRCVQSSVVRLGVHGAQGGAAQFPDVGDAPLSVAGLVPGPGYHRAYQGWYRDAASFCTPAAYNLTAGVRTIWTP